MKRTMTTRRMAAEACLLLMAVVAQATHYHVVTTGNDNNAGTEQAPWATLRKAVETAAAGDIVWIHGGTYTVTPDQVMDNTNTGAWALVYKCDKTGTKGHPIAFLGVEGERPVFDFSLITATESNGKRITAFAVTGSYYYFRNFETTGVNAVETTDGSGNLTNSQSEHFRVFGRASHNTFENLAMHDAEAIGLYISERAAQNLVLNCDAYNNGSTKTKVYGNCDGFGCHVRAEAEGNQFVGCRAWMNNDDGFDCINAYAPVSFVNCWALKNGNCWQTSDNKPKGDGNGIKAGGYGMNSAVTITDVPEHRVVNCMASRNNTNGIYSNHHLGGISVEGCTSYYNQNNYSMVNRQDGTVGSNGKGTDVDGYGHTLTNNLSCRPVKNDITALDLTSTDNTLTNNTFQDADNDLHDVTAHFSKWDDDVLKEARLADGTLPVVNFLVLKKSSYWYGKGVGYSYDHHADYAEAARKESGIIDYPDEETTGIEKMRNGGNEKMRNGGNEKMRNGENEKWSSMFNVSGQRVGRSYTGIVVADGRKRVVR